MKPNGLPSQSPGLRGTSYPGSPSSKHFQPQRGCGQRHTRTQRRRHCHNRVAVWEYSLLTQGRRWCANLGLEAAIPLGLPTTRIHFGWQVRFVLHHPLGVNRRLQPGAALVASAMNTTLLGDLGDLAAGSWEKRQGAGALQDASRCLAAQIHAPASWTAAGPPPLSPADGPPGARPVAFPRGTLPGERLDSGRVRVV